MNWLSGTATQQHPKLHYRTDYEATPSKIYYFKELNPVPSSFYNSPVHQFQRVSGDDQLLIGGDDHDTSASTWTSENGYYSFLVPNGIYTIQPPTYSSFTPIERSIEVNGGGVFGQDFSAN